MNEKFKLLTENIEGTDYVVGNVHGCYRQLRFLLAKLRFNTSADRLISTGNLIDKGPDSLECLELLREDWFYSVRGNHEDMMLDYLFPKVAASKSYGHGFWAEHGGDWFKISKHQNRVIDLARKVAKLPLVISIDNRFNVVQAELLSNGDGTEIIQSDLKQWNFTKAEENEMMWGRNIPEARFEMFRPDLNWTICGSEAVKKPGTKCKHLFINTGVHINGCLTIIEIPKSGLTVKIHRLDVKSNAFSTIEYNLSLN